VGVVPPGFKAALNQLVKTASIGLTRRSGCGAAVAVDAPQASLAGNHNSLETTNVAVAGGTANPCRLLVYQGPAAVLTICLPTLVGWGSIVLVIRSAILLHGVLRCL
jgi:hypothetical protein